MDGCADLDGSVGCDPAWHGTVRHGPTRHDTDPMGLACCVCSDHHKYPVRRRVHERILHMQGIAHRDLKPENVIMTNKVCICMRACAAPVLA